MKKLIKICEYLAFIVFLVMLVFLTSKLSLLLAIPVFLLIYFLCKKIKVKNTALLIFIIALITRIISIFILKVEIADDFKTMYDAAQSLLKGDLSFMQGFYFRTYTYQLGLVFLEALFLKIINNVVILKIVNSIVTSFIVLFIFLIIKKVFNEEKAKFLSLTYLFYLYPVYLNSVLTNQHIQILLMLIVIYLLISKKDNIKTYLLIAIILGISNFFRAESIIFILGILVYNIFYINKDNYKNKLKNLGTLILSYLIITNILSFTLYSTPLFKVYKEDSNLVKDVTYWKFYCGLNTEHNGLYNNDDVEKYFTTNNEKELLINRVKEDYKKYPLLFIKKEVILWTQTNYDLRITNNWNNNLYNFLLNINQGFLNLILLLFVISLIPEKTDTKKEVILIKILLALYFGVYMFIEISPRYAYIIHILIFLILPLAIEKIENLSKKVGEKYVRKDISLKRK